MDLARMIIFGILGTSSLIFLCYALFILLNKPYEFIKLNYSTSKSNAVYQWFMLFSPFFVFWFGMYHVGYFLLGWMPESWGSFDEDGFVSLRSGLSATLGFIGGFFLTLAISRGIVAQTQLSAIKLKKYLNKQIESAHITGELNELQKDLEKFLAGESIIVFNIELDSVIKGSCLPSEVLQEIFSDAIKTIKRQSTTPTKTIDNS